MIKSLKVLINEINNEINWKYIRDNDSEETLSLLLTLSAFE